MGEIFLRCIFPGHFSCNLLDYTFILCYSSCNFNIDGCSFSEGFECIKFLGLIINLFKLFRLTLLIISENTLITRVNKHTLYHIKNHLRHRSHLLKLKQYRIQCTGQSLRPKFHTFAKVPSCTLREFWGFENDQGRT